MWDMWIKICSGVCVPIKYIIVVGNYILIGTITNIIRGI
jgi:hypothetical protein